eukprot:8404730-Alexandrium_andersonii.AAC.1
MRVRLARVAYASAVRQDLLGAARRGFPTVQPDAIPEAASAGACSVALASFHNKVLGAAVVRASMVLDVMSCLCDTSRL